MEPLSPRIRRLYLYLFVLLFLAILPLVILYADGWRFREGFGFVKTGGIFISVPYPNAEVFVDGERVGESGFLDRSFYIDNLAPSAYSVRVEADEFITWNRILVVEPQLVTDARALLIATDIHLAEVTTRPPVLDQVQVSAETFVTYAAAFATSTPIVASSTLPIDESDGAGLFLDRGDVSVKLMSADALPPSYFCGRPSFCVTEIPIERGAPTTSSAQFYSGGVVYLTDAGLYFSEVDIRPTALQVTLYEKPDIEFRILGDALLVKDGTKILQVVGL